VDGLDGVVGRGGRRREQRGDNEGSQQKTHDIAPDSCLDDESRWRLPMTGEAASPIWVARPYMLYSKYSNFAYMLLILSLFAAQ
jgi:hypothetical protein